ncbi:MAG: aldo/keto reductase [Planctomycetota bacterium]
MSGITRREAMALGAGVAAGFAFSRSGFASSSNQQPALRRRLGRSGHEVSIVGFGGLTIAQRNSDQSTVDRLLNQALDNGLNFIDTAECYGAAGQNQSEILIGNAVAHRRDEYILSTKVGHEDGEFGQGPQDWGRDAILRTIDRSLERLRTDHIDIVHLHSPPIEVLERGDAAEALREARETGKVRTLACSNDGARIMAAIESDDFDIIQVSLNVLDQDPLDRVLPAARARDLGFILKRPVCNAIWRHEDPPESTYYRNYWDRMRELEFDFLRGDARDDRGPEGAGGMVLRWALATPGVHTAIVGTATPGRWSQNNTNASEAMSEREWSRIRDRWLEVAGDRWRRPYGD